MCLSQSDSIIHQLPEYADAGYPPSYEYQLPAHIEDPMFSIIHPWFQHLSQLTTVDAHKCLAERWKNIQHNAARCLRDHILEYETRSIVIAGGCVWLLCVNGNAGINLVGPPLNENNAIAEHIPIGMEDNCLLVELLTHFHSLREDFPPGGGYLIDNHSWEYLNDPFIEKEVKGYSKWKNSLIIFHARNGDLLLQHPSGKVGWWVADEIKIKEAYNDLETCIMDFIHFQNKPWPFDSYG